MLLKTAYQIKLKIVTIIPKVFDNINKYRFVLYFTIITCIHKMLVYTHMWSNLSIILYFHIGELRQPAIWL